MLIAALFTRACSPPQRAVTPSHEGRDRFRVRDVARVEARVRAVRPKGFECRAAALPGASGENDARAGVRECLAYRQADSRRAARDEGDAAIHAE